MGTIIIGMKIAGKKLRTFIFVIPKRLIAKPTNSKDPTADIETVTVSLK